MKDSILTRQHILLKIGFVIFQTILISFATFWQFVALLIFNFFFLVILQPRILFIWIRTLVKLLPLYISILIFGLIFDSAFLHQLSLLASISLILLLSVYLINTSSIPNIIGDTANWSNYPLLADLRFFMIALIFFIPEMAEQFRKIERRKFSLAMVVQIFEKSLTTIHKVGEQSEKTMQNQKRKLFFFPNFLLLVTMLFQVSLYFLVG